MTAYPIRPVDESELLGFGSVPQAAFNSSWPADAMVELDRLVFEPERSLAAFDGDQIVGTAVAFSLELTIPGGVADAAGVSFVAVLPSHRRRGVLSSLMRRQLSDVSSGHEPIAALFASEAAIYGRFGYGSAADDWRFVINRGEGKLADQWTGSTDAPRLRLAEPKAVAASLASVFDTVRLRRPGIVNRPGRWWEAELSDPEFMREGSSPLGCVLAEDQSGARGYALYAVKGGWDEDGIPSKVLSVNELFATDPTTYAALWADLLNRDLISEVRTRLRPADDPLRYLLPDTRHVRARVSDGLWVRLVDLQAALTQRRYAAEVDVVVEVADDLLPANAGRWRLQAGGLSDQAKPTCERTTAAPDIALPIAALGAAYLGGARLGVLAEAGVVTELRNGALGELSAAMWWDPAPWPASMF